MPRLLTPSESETKSLKTAVGEKHDEMLSSGYDVTAAATKTAAMVTSTRNKLKQANERHQNGKTRGEGERVAGVGIITVNCIYVWNYQIKMKKCIINT